MFNSDWFYEHIIYDLNAMVTKAQDGKVKIWILIYHIWLKEGTMNCEMQNLILHYTSSLYLFIETLYWKMIKFTYIIFSEEKYG